MKKKYFAILTILLCSLTLACVFAETAAGQVLTGTDAQHQDAEHSESVENNPSQSISDDSSTHTSLVSDQSSEGYYLFSPLRTNSVYLMDSDGFIVHSWATEYTPGNTVYLLENSQLLFTGGVPNRTFRADGAGGIIQLIEWDGTVTWEYEYSSPTHLQHHDVEMLPNGNVLMIAWQLKTEDEAIAAGRDPSLLNEGEIWYGSVIEVMPTGPTTGEIVWEWHAWDHLIQEYDPTKDNYGVVADHPELINLNFIFVNAADWFHMNSIDYNAELDQIILSNNSFSEIWIIDHSTTTTEAAGHTGGNIGIGGDLLYRWGNPQAYDAGTDADQQLFHQHDVEWIGADLPGKGNILIFNNGWKRPGETFSSVVEIAPPVNPDGSYNLTPGSAFSPDDPYWVYMADPASNFYAKNISGSQRLLNGNTLILDGPEGHIFEVTTTGEMVWEYTIPNAVFRVTKIEADYPGLEGRNLQPGEKLEASEDSPDTKPGKSQDDSQGGQRGGLPQAAFDACSNLTEGADCTVQNANRTINGSCEYIQNQLACTPGAEEASPGGGAP